MTERERERERKRESKKKDYIGLSLWPLQCSWYVVQLDLGLRSQTCSTNTLKPQDQDIQSIRIKQITTQSKQNCIAYWGTQAQSKIQCYLALNQQYTMANYLTTVTDQNLRKTLTKYRLSQHSLAIEKGRHRKPWLPVEERLCNHCTTAEPGSL